ncbi:MAG: hypothetical protein QM747_20340 [Nocardioides sp.]
MSLELAPPVTQTAQVLTIALGSPLVTGVIARVEAVLQGRHGPGSSSPTTTSRSSSARRRWRRGGAGPFFLAAPCSPSPAT